MVRSLGRIFLSIFALLFVGSSFVTDGASVPIPQVAKIAQIPKIAES